MGYSINKILSTAESRNRVGVSFDNGILSVTHNEREVIRCLLKIVKDTQNGKLTLKKLLDAAAKKSYLDELEESGFLPEASNELKQPKEITKKPLKFSTEEKKIINKPPVRKHLIRKENSYHFGDDPDLSRFKDVWNELQFKLTLNGHINAISVLTRVIIEFSVKYYIDTNKMQVKKDEGLARKIELVAKNMESKGYLSADRTSEIIVYAKEKEIFSAKTLNAFVHSMKSFPDPEVMTALWDNIEPFVLDCINRSIKNKKAA